ncbi:endolysin-like domain-containing protein [Bifidobacterium platyrrhinorum]|uniref:Peptidoglycan hydrolase n=1 Tax=Bifidobacterium platyrrhinorum TaxID=2661628 RepID=A0A6L9SW89_9BIFI|nr:NlpC/P60 family protein [Bifidobacterium platyrrhinorum]NEG56113.1 peptidoglycan hydrolase [Bifidobacterium platyrrhinorum]
MGNLNTLVNRMRYWCASVSLGYDQSNRWDIRPGGECDCSSLVIHALREAGFDTGGATYTGNMSSNLTARGWRRLPADGNPRPGDILLNDIHHVAVYLGNGMLAQASIDERGKASGGKAGDQTGRETNVRAYYSYPWNCYLRYGADTVITVGPLKVDGSCGTATVSKWQAVMGTPVDGVISGQVVPDQKTYWRPALDTSAVSYGGRGSQLIGAVQRTLGLKHDGLLGPKTIKAIQAHLGVTQDASFGPATVRALQTRLNTGRF